MRELIKTIPINDPVIPGYSVIKMVPSKAVKIIVRDDFKQVISHV